MWFSSCLFHLLLQCLLWRLHLSSLPAFLEAPSTISSSLDSKHTQTNLSPPLSLSVSTCSFTHWMLPPHVQLRPTLPPEPSPTTMSRASGWWHHLLPSGGWADAGATTGRDQSTKGSVKACRFLLYNLWNRGRPQLPNGWVLILPLATATSSHWVPIRGLPPRHPLNTGQQPQIYTQSKPQTALALLLESSTPPCCPSTACPRHLLASPRASLAVSMVLRHRQRTAARQQPHASKEKGNFVAATPSLAWAGSGNFCTKTEWEARAALTHVITFFRSTVEGQQRSF